MGLVYGEGWALIHPYDVATGVETSGYVAGTSLADSPFATSRNAIYGGSQPSVVRTVLRALPGIEGATFVDLGTGKGRPAFIAGEFPFREIIGVELSTGLVEIARRNMEMIRARFPDRPLAKIVNEDAATFPFPPGPLVVFLYNPFGAAVLQRVVANLEETLASYPRPIWIIYYNPVHGACFDASPSFRRHLARTIPYARKERGFGPDEADPVVVWQAGANYPAEQGAEAKIVITNPDYRAELVSN